MFAVKVWSILVSVILLVVRDDDLFRVRAFQVTQSQLVFGGYIGCMYDDVCQNGEICKDFSFFGMCVNPLITDYLSDYETNVSKLKILFDDKDSELQLLLKSFGWDNPYVQCVVRTILQSGRTENLSSRTVKDLCGLPLSDKSYERVKHNFDVEELETNFAGSYQEGFEYDEEDYPKVRITDKSESSSVPDFEARRDFVYRRTPPKRVIPYHHPAYGYYPDEPVRTWIWIKFENESLSPLQASKFLEDLTNRLHLASPITQFYRRDGGAVLFFNVPEMSGSTAEELLTVMERQKDQFSEYQIASMGLGRTMPRGTQPKTVRTSAASQKKFGDDAHLMEDKPPMKLLAVKSEQSQKFKTALTICLTLLGVVTLVFVAHVVHRRLTGSKQHDLEDAFQMKSRSNFGYSPIPNNKNSGPIARLRRVLSKSEKPQTPKETDQIISERAVRSAETRHSQPSTRSAELSHQRLSQDTSSSTISSSDNREKLSDHKGSSMQSERGSLSSWGSEPVTCGIDVRTGHLILSYLETYFCDRERLATEWETVRLYQSEEATPCVDAEKPENAVRNRGAPLPYEQSRVKLRNAENDYINASLLYDHSPRNPVYIATPGPCRETLNQFWQMVWEQSSVVLVCLERAEEMRQDGQASDAEDTSVQYWPSSGTERFGDFEVHLVSEHKVCENYLVRSFYLKNLDVDETRTVTQFHYLTWTDSDLRSEAGTLLEFRRKVNRSFRGMMSPIVVHCADGCGRSGAYILLDLVLNRISRGIKEIDISASLEHLRDQRRSMVQTREQYEFVFAAVAQEVDAMLKANTSPTT